MTDQPENPQKTTLAYGHAIRDAFEYLLQKYPNVFVIGQGLWSPWYVGNSMTDLDKQFGKERIIDTPICEDSCTGLAIGASLCGYRPIVIHPRVDFMILATNQIVNQAAKWSHMLGGQTHPAVTIRGIVNRGGQQGAQHSQHLHAWYAHVPGLRVVLPSTPEDARDLLIASVLCNDPVVYCDDRWLYQRESPYRPPRELSLKDEKSMVTRDGSDLTIVGSGYTSWQAESAAEILEKDGISSEVVDLRIVNPLDYSVIISSLEKTGRLCVVDGGWETCGLAGEIIAGVMERIDLRKLRSSPLRLTLPAAPAPTSGPLEDDYYYSTKTPGIVEHIKKKFFV